MRISAQRINNKGVTISKSRVEEVSTKYVKQYNRLCEKLYDLGYISSPLYFDDKEFWYNLIDEHPEFYNKYFVNSINGVVSNVLDQIEYAILCDEDEELCTLLKDVLEILQASKAVEDINEALSHIKFTKKSDLVVCKASISVSDKVYSTSKFCLDSPYVQECFYVPEDKEVFVHNFGIEILRTLFKKLNINETFTEDSDSLLLGGNLKIKDDCRFLKSILMGDITGSGKYFSVIKDYASKYYKESFMSDSNSGYIEYISQLYLDAIPSCIEHLNQFRGTLSDDYSELYITSTSVIYLRNKTQNKSYSCRTLYVGEHLIDYTTGKSLGVLNRLQGFSGSYIYEYDRNIQNYAQTNLKVKMYQRIQDKGQLVTSNVMYIPTICVKPDIKTQISNEFVSVEEMKKYLGVDSMESIASEVAKALSTIYGEYTFSYRYLVGMMLQTLFCILCDYTPEGRTSPNELYLDKRYDWLDEKSYLDACIEAEGLFKEFGF